MYSTEESQSPTSDPNSDVGWRRQETPHGERITGASISSSRATYDAEDPSADTKLPAVSQVRRTDNVHDEQPVLNTGILPLDEDMSTEARPEVPPAASDRQSSRPASTRPSTSGQASSSSRSTVAAVMIDPDEESRVVNERVQKALREERERTVGVAHPIPLIPVPNVQQRNAAPPPQEARHSSGWSGKKRIRVGLVVAIFIAIAVAVPVAVLLTRNNRAPVSTLVPSMEPSGQEPTIITFPPVPAPISISDSLLSTSLRTTTIVVIMVAFVSAVLVGLAVFCRQRKLNESR